MSEHHRFYGNGEVVTEDVPWLMFTADHVPHWSVRWPERFPGEVIPAGAAYLCNRPLTEAERAWALTIKTVI